MDCAVIPLSHKYAELSNFFLIETIDFFYPLIEDPYLQGKIACANVLSDQYAMGVHNVDNMLMVLAASTDMSESERDIITKELIRGFCDLASQADVKITGGQSVMNPWPIIGGVASSVCREGDFIRPDGAQLGDVLVLTKPLGTQVAVNARLWVGKERWTRHNLDAVTTVSEVRQAYAIAADQMARLNRNAARLMHKYRAHAATDVTGFGLLGHSRNLAKATKVACQFRIHTLPVIAATATIDRAANHAFRLVKGMSAETSGGLLIALDGEQTALAFIRELQQLEGGRQCGWIIGVVEGRGLDAADANTSVIDENPIVIDVME